MKDDLQVLAKKIIDNMDTKNLEWAFKTVCHGDKELFGQVSRIVFYKLRRTTPLFTSWSPSDD